jgi:large subunit ribosomal protein L21
MYAVIETGGKQYRVELGTELAVERLDVTPGTTINLERVLLVADGDNAQIGTPIVTDALVTADVLRQDRGEKLIVFKYRPKARHRSKNGHRQELTILRVADIRFSGRSAADEAGAAQTEKQAEREQAKKDADKKAAADQALAAKLAAESAATDKAADEAPKTTTKKAPAAKPKAEAAAKPKAETAAKAATPAKAEAAPAKKPVAKKPAAEAKPKTSRAKTTGSSTKKDE